MWLSITIIFVIYFWSKVNIWTVNCAWAAVKVFETDNVSTWEGLEPPIFGFMPNALSIWAIRARHLLSHVLNTGSGGIDILSKFNIWTVNCAWATAYIFDTRTDVFVLVSKFFRQNMSRPERHSNLNIRTYQASIFNALKLTKLYSLFQKSLTKPCRHGVRWCMGSPRVPHCTVYAI